MTATLTASIEIWPKIDGFPGRPPAIAPGDLDDLCLNITNRGTDPSQPYTAVITWPDGNTTTITGNPLDPGAQALHDLAHTGHWPTDIGTNTNATTTITETA